MVKASRVMAIDFLNDLTSPYARRWFVGSMSFLLIFSIIMVWLATIAPFQPWLKDVLVSLFSEASAGSGIVLAFYAVYLYFIGPNTPAQEVTVLRAEDIGTEIHKLFEDSRRYIFWGRSGAFFRSRTLQVLDKQAQENRRQITVDVLLPDPREERLAKGYRGILKALDETGSEHTLLANILATCLACAIADANNVHLDVRVHLSKFLPTFRIDMSDNGAILTQDDKEKAALRFKDGGQFFDLWEAAVATERNASHLVSWDREQFAGKLLVKETCTSEVIDAIGIDVPREATTDREVARLIDELTHRYG